MTIANLPPITKPHLITDRWTEPFWAAAQEGRLVIATCADCGAMRMPPGPYCPACRSQELEWTLLSGRGTVYSYTVVYRAIVSGTEDTIPYVPVVVTLEGGGGCRLTSAVIESAVEDIHIDALVELVWVAGTGAMRLPFFRLLAKQ